MLFIKLKNIKHYILSIRETTTKQPMSKVVIASYNCQSAFRVPKGLDLDDKSQVKSWGVKWDRLYIELADGKEIQVENYWDDHCNDFEYPDDDPVIEEADDYGCFGNEDKIETVEEALARTKHKEEGMKIILNGLYGKVVEEPVVEEPVVCDDDACNLIECCCEADKLQVIADDKRATDEGFKEIDGKWRKVTLVTRGWEQSEEERHAEFIEMKREFDGEGMDDDVWFGGGGY
jgi:hypothetical protein